MMLIKVANVLNEHFLNSVRCLAGKGGYSAHLLDINDKKNALDNIIVRFKHYPSIIAIKQKGFTEKFDFTMFSVDDVSA